MGIDIEGATVLVTGASSGIGAALVPMLASRGARVAALARRADRLDAVLARCAGDGHRAYPCDLGDLVEAERTAHRVWDELGGIDVVVHNAAIPKRRAVQSLTTDEVEHVMTVNYLAPTRMALALLPRMLERGRGTNVFVSSLGGRLGIVHEAAYCGSKFALCGWAESMHMDLLTTPLEVRLVIPGPIDTEIWDQPDNDAPLYDGELLPPETVAADIVAAIEGDTFETYSPDMVGIVSWKTTDIDAFLEGAAGMARHEAGTDSGRWPAVKALVFGAFPDPAPPQPAADAPRLVRNLASTPMDLVEVPDPPLLGDDWAVIRPRLTGICGSDTKQVLMDFEDADDSPMTAFISFPQVLGHEVVATVEEVGPAVEGIAPGQRVVLNPWLSCGPRGLDPVCPACAAGDWSLCWRFLDGRLTRGIHTGNSSDATGGFAELVPAHQQMMIPVPDGVSDEVAVLGDPFAVSLHAITRNPPPEGGKVVVYGAGALGTCATAILKALYPTVEVAVVAAWDAQVAVAERLGAKVLRPEPRLALIEALADWSGGVLRTPWEGLPTCFPGFIDVVYDTIGAPATFEVDVRVLKARGTMVQLGLSSWTRAELTPMYFKEIRWVGSNAFGIEEVEGVRQHGIAHHLDLAASGRIDLTGMLTHTFPLTDWRTAWTTLIDQEHTGAIKVAFDFR